jgi:hypothetical protein
MIPGTIAVLLPLAALLQWSLLFVKKDGSWRAALLKGAVATGLSLAAITEGLSPFSLLGARPIALCWLGLGLILFALLWQRRRWLPGLAGSRQAPRGQALAFWLASALLALMALVSALASPPNSYDAMTYHLPRVMQWLQAGSVRHFPCPYPPQLYHPPLAEYAIAHLQAMLGSDIADNLVEWCSLVGAAIAASALCAALGGGAAAQAFAALALASLPMALLQASTSLNDLAVSFWILSFAFFCVSPDDEGASWFFQGASLGLALLCKGTAFFFALPFGLWLACRHISRGSRGLAPGLGVAATALALNAPFLWRNLSLSGAPYGTNTDILSGRFDAAALLGTLMKNAATQLNTPWAAINGGAYRAVALALRGLGQGASDPALTYNHSPAFGAYGVMIAHFRHEDVVGNFWQFILFPFALLAAKPGKPRRYALATLAGFVAFSTLLRWQPENARLLLPFLALATPCLGLGLERLPWASLRLGLALLFFAVALDAQLFCWTRPLLGPGNIFQSDRTSLYFRNSPQDEDEAREVCALIRRNRPPSLGLLRDNAAIEYPLWALIKDSPGGPPQIINVDVTNASASLEPPAAPEELLVIQKRPPESPQASGQKYRKIWLGKNYGLYRIIN